MKTMKGLGMNKMLGTLKRRATASGSSSVENIPAPANDSPEEAAITAVKKFCSSDNKTGDEVLYLPPIVEAAESSPAAAAECARLIRKYLGRSYVAKPSYQYNAVMLMRILADNPGPTFTRNFDKKFVDAVHDLLKVLKDRSVLNLLIETLDTFEYTKIGDEGLTPLIEVWRKDKEKVYKQLGYSAPLRPSPPQSERPDVVPQDTYYSRSHRPTQLPPPDELASRLEEARTSAKLLTQFVTSSTAEELLASDLVKEFSSRCQSASKSMQAYMAADNPGPDNDTMETLLDVNEHLQAALNAHQRAVLSAKKSLGIEGGGAGTPMFGTPSPDRASMGGANGSGSAQGSSTSRETSRVRKDNGKGREEEPPLPALPKESDKGKGAASYEPPPGPPPGGVNDAENPFRDPHEGGSRQGGSSFLGSEALVFDSFNPGFRAAGSASGSRRQPGDDIYDSEPRR